MTTAVTHRAPGNPAATKLPALPTATQVPGSSVANGKISPRVQEPLEPRNEILAVSNKVAQRLARKGMPVQRGPGVFDRPLYRAEFMREDLQSERDPNAIRAAQNRMDAVLQRHIARPNSREGSDSGDTSAMSHPPLIRMRAMASPAQVRANGFTAHRGIQLDPLSLGSQEPQPQPGRRDGAVSQDAIARRGVPVNFRSIAGASPSPEVSLQLQQPSSAPLLNPQQSPVVTPNGLGDPSFVQARASSRSNLALAVQRRAPQPNGQANGQRDHSAFSPLHIRNGSSHKLLQAQPQPLASPETSSELAVRREFPMAPLALQAQQQQPAARAPLLLVVGRQFSKKMSQTPDNIAAAAVARGGLRHKRLNLRTRSSTKEAQSSQPASAPAVKDNRRNKMIVSGQDETVYYMAVKSLRGANRAAQKQ